MDKLRELLVYKFWGLLAIALLAPIIGWWLGSDSAAKEITTRQSAINQAYGRIPSGELVNDTWIQGAQKINQEQQKLIDEAWLALGTKQIQLKTWPPEIAEEMAKLGQSDIIDSRIRLRYFPTMYQREWAETWMIVDPLRVGEFNEQTERYTTKGIVEFSPELLPYNNWGLNGPTSEQMFEGQEDIWLYRSLLRAIADVNKGVDTRADAVIPKIMSLELLNGYMHKPAIDSFTKAGGTDTSGTTGTPLAASTTTTTASTSGRGRGRDDDDDDGGGSTGFIGGQATAGRGIGGYVSQFGSTYKDFFVPDTGTTGAGGAGTGGLGGRLGGSRGDDDDDESSGTLNTGRRYVEDTSQYRTRAFNLKVEIDHRRLPDLLASLADCPWPIKILRVRQANEPQFGRRGGQSAGSRNRALGATTGQRRGFTSGLSGGRRGDDPIGGNPTADVLQRQTQSGRSLGWSIENPYIAIVEITGTMRIFKTKEESASFVDQSPEGATTPAPASPQPTEDQAEEVAAQEEIARQVRPSPRTPELDDDELMENFVDTIGGNRQMGGAGFGGRRGDDDE